MNSYGFFRAAAAVPTVKVADTRHNTDEICRLAGEAFEKEASLVVFPELSLTGSTCGDIFTQSILLKGAEDGIRKIAEFSRGKETVIAAGAPIPFRNKLYDCAVVIYDGKIKGIVPKTYISSEQSRWFSSGKDFLREGRCEEIGYAGQECLISPNLLFQLGHATLCIELGEDAYAPIPQLSMHVLQGAQITACLSSDAEILMADRFRKNHLERHSTATISGYIYASAGYGESTQDMVYAGAASIWEYGTMLAENDRFKTEGSVTYADIDIERIDNQRKKSAHFNYISPDGTSESDYSRHYSRVNICDSFRTDFEKELFRHVEPHPFVPADDLDYRCSEILSIQTAALVKRLSHIGCHTAVIGISGGLDSTLALLVTALAFDRLGWDHDRIVAVTMPGFGTTSRTKNNAWDLMQALGVTCREISIKAACEQHFKDICHDPAVRDATYENTQARERTQILMDIANQTGGIVIGTGDLSELALGWATYNGDHMSMYGVNAGVPKTLVRHLVKWAAENSFCKVRDILLDIVDTPISPELLPANENGEIQQVTEDLVGPYELHDFFIWNFMRFGYAPEKIFFLARKAFDYDDETINKWLMTFIRRFFSQQFKRSCLPDGPKVGTISLSPRGDWQMPSDAWSSIFMENTKAL